jgi:4-hydroxy-tetrahydrodipicolinate synthase
MTEKIVNGVWAAAGTPRRADGALDEELLRRELEFLMSRGIRGFAVNGATGEFCLTTPAELEAIVGVTREATRGRAEFVCGIGAPGIHGSVERGRIAIAGGAKGLLLPMPFFFPYSQDDLEAFCRETAARLDSRILLYNLPKFTSGLEPATVCALIRECDHIVGIKDSSGNLDILRVLSEQGVDACRIVGSDAALAPARRENVCDAVISGCACAVPELLLAVFEHGGRPDSEEFRGSCRVLDEFIGSVSDFPVPWALKWIAEARGIVPASFAQPISKKRAEQAAELLRWFAAWAPSRLESVALQ